jgi:hypothetical protein
VIRTPRSRSPSASIASSTVTRLAVGQADDEIRALLDPLENRLWGAPSAGERGG